ncbi:hypothetical protein [Candidatus Tisiphia endosymbiont of Ditula angustiorana]|uniref:hypothetical protein n=1 Tax=Candidatus Tisiphia endosymbiont of Ditula angustiorana TaxID=3066272 RepID=UPI00312C8EC5
MGINAEPYYTEHTERRFNQGEYDQDVTEATNTIQLRQKNIDNFYAAMTVFKQQEAEQAIEQEKQQKIAAEKARLDAIEQEKQQKIAAEKARLAAEVAEQARLDAVKHGNDVISANISKQQKANFDMLQSLNSKQRAFFLSELFGKSDSESMTMISIIKSLGVDADELAYYAIKKTHNELFELSDKQNPLLSSTLLRTQHTSFPVLRSSIYKALVDPVTTVYNG